MFFAKAFAKNFTIIVKKLLGMVNVIMLLNKNYFLKLYKINS